MGYVVFAGEMQGTVHRLLLETRQNELKPGSVLLLKQVWGASLYPPALEEAPLSCLCCSLPSQCPGKEWQGWCWSPAYWSWVKA